jgi:8-oxo-dGTP pyrophosphatase MutT (NUDIX family)
MITYYASSDQPYNLAAGGAVFDDNKVLLLSRIENGVTTYHLPKGTLEPEEALEACATREILEESGAEVRLEAYLGAIHAEFKFRQLDSSGIRSGDEINCDKVTHYYLAKLKMPNLRPMDGEHSGREWVSISEAKDLLKLNDNPKQEWLIVERLERYLKLWSS